MASTIAHEVNNPLEAVTNLLYLLRPLIADTAGLEYLATAESEIARVSHIAKQTLGFYHEHSAASLISVSELVQHAIAVYEPRCALNGIAIERSLRSTSKILLRRGEMMQVVSNLIANSMYAMVSGGTLYLSTDDSSGQDSSGQDSSGQDSSGQDSSETGEVVITARDTGVGIAAHDLPKVFDAFFTTRSATGTGIGLFVAKQFVEGHSGRIELESSNDSRAHGTTIRIYLPFRTSNAAHQIPRGDDPGNEIVASVQQR